MEKPIDASLLGSVVEKIFFPVLAFVTGWIIKLQKNMGQIPTLQDKIYNLETEVKDHDQQLQSLDKRIALLEQILAEIAPLSKGCVATTTKLTTIVEILMDERKRQN